MNIGSPFINAEIGIMLGFAILTMILSLERTPTGKFSRVGRVSAVVTCIVTVVIMADLTLRGLTAGYAVGYGIL